MTIETIKQWKLEYSTVPKDQILSSDITPENIIDWIKLKYIRSYLPKRGIIVEIGAGSGRFLTNIALENEELEVIGIDFVSSSMVHDNIIKYNLNGISVNANAFSLPIKSNSVDAVISGGLLEHFNINELDEILKEMYRILKPHGLLYAEIVPDKFSLCRPIKLNTMSAYENKYTKNIWKNVLICKGFKYISVVSGIVIPPNFYKWFRKFPLLQITNKFKYIISYLDNTIISDIFGFSYYIIAWK